MQIQRWYDGRILFSGEYVSLYDAMVDAVANNISLAGASLVGANLAGARLVGANLAGASLARASLARARLAGAGLAGASLADANLAGARLADANLAGANLARANLARADLDGAGLAGARLNWNCHDLIAEILRRAAGEDVDKKMTAGLVLVGRDWCWSQFLAIDRPLREWALDELAEWVQPGDGAPEVLATRAAAKQAGRPAVTDRTRTDEQDTDHRRALPDDPGSG